MRRYDEVQLPKPLEGTMSSLEGRADFRRKTTLGTALAGLLFLSPFALNNLLQGRLALGLGSLGVVAVLAGLARSTVRGRSTRWPLLMFPPILIFLMISVWSQGVIGVMWSYPAIFATYFILTERWAQIANFTLLLVIIPESFVALEMGLAIRAAATLTVVSVFSALAIRVIEAQQVRLQQLAVTDSLTGIQNRMNLASMLDLALTESQQEGEPVSLLALDMDGFKEINDTWGHDAGDRVLMGLGAVLRDRLRSGDHAFRLGGEEFAILLHNADSDQAHLFADRLRAAIESTALLEERVVTASFGVASAEFGDDWRSLLARADAFMYEAKSAGRNTVRPLPFGENPAPGDSAERSSAPTGRQSLIQPAEL